MCMCIIIICFIILYIHSAPRVTHTRKVYFALSHQEIHNMYLIYIYTTFVLFKYLLYTFRADCDTHTHTSARMSPCDIYILDALALYYCTVVCTFFSESASRVPSYNKYTLYYYYSILFIYFRIILFSLFFLLSYICFSHCVCLAWAECHHHHHHRLCTFIYMHNTHTNTHLRAYNV